MGEKRGTKALEVWCKRVTDGYPGVKVENMTTSWRDGLAFCAIIHHFRPDLIDFHSLDKRDVLHNNELAFRIAERHLGIPALLDAEDMVEYEVPDRLSMLTYLSQFYQTFAQRSPGNSPTSRTPIKRSSLSPEPASLSPASQSPPTKVSARGDAHGRMLRRDPCNQCGQPVFLAERLVVSSARLLYHRTCFRCARCSSQLTLANYYETEDGRFCCETCPDEERSYRGEDSAPAPLATGDPSSSEQSRPSSVTVDTNDLPSNDACDPVNNVDRAQSSETEDYAKDQSLSLVQLRRKLFENVTPKNRSTQVLDSGQVRVSNGIKQTEPAEHPKTDKYKLMKLKSSTEDVSISENDKEDVSMELDTNEKSTDFNVKETVVSVVKTIADYPSDAEPKSNELTASKAMEDEPPVPETKDDELLGPKAKDDDLSVPKGKEDESRVPNAIEEDLSDPEGKGDESLVPKTQEEDPSVSKAQEYESLVPKAKEDDASVPEAKEDEPLVPKAKEDDGRNSRLLEAKEDDSRLPEAKEDDSPLPEAKEDYSALPEAKKDDPPVPIVQEDETPVLGVKVDEPLVVKVKEDELLVIESKGEELSEMKEDELSVYDAKEDTPVSFNSREHEQLASKCKENEPIVHQTEEDELLELNERKTLESEAKEGGPFMSGGTEDEKAREQQDKSMVGIDVDLPQCKVESELSENVPQTDIEVESQCNTEDGEMLLKSVQDPLTERSEEEGESTYGQGQDDDKKSTEKEIRNHLPPRPPPPAVKVTSSTTPKPPVTPRKTSLAASPGKPAPVVTRPEKPTVSRVPSYPAELNPFGDVSDEDDDAGKEESSNPFGSEEEEEVTLRKKEEPLNPPQRPATHHGGSVRKENVSPAIVDKRRFIPAPANLNPFWEDGEEPEEEEEDVKPAPLKPPVPKPRTMLSLASDTSANQSMSPFNNRSTLTRSSGKFGSANSLSSIVSSASTMRRKKHAAPPPPVSSAHSTLSPRATSLSPGSATSMPSSPTLSSGRSTLGRSRKSRPAPQPPSMSPSTPNRTTWNPSTHYRPPTVDSSPLLTSTPKAKLEDEWQEGKLNKDEVNRNRQNQLTAQIAGDLVEDLADDSSIHSGDKSSHGKWKRKKGPAPPRPIPQRRQTRTIPLKELKRELEDIEVLQLELERQGVNLERTIRRKFDENPDASESSMTPDIEDLVLQLFELVNEKNELFRKQAELMYLRRQQRLEEEHADLEYQIRILMEQPERNKTDSDKAKEEKLIQRLVEVVERRNEIVECLEMDRLREAEEDHSIHSRLELFASKSLALNDAYVNDLYKSTPALTCCALKEKKKKKDKTKKGTLRLYKKEKQVDADKDIDEAEVEHIAKEKKTKRKWF